MAWRRICCPKWRARRIGAIYILKAVLPELAAVSRVFQRGSINFAHILPSITYTTDKLTNKAQAETPITQLQVDVKESGRLSTCEFRSNKHEIQVLHNLLMKYTQVLISRMPCQWAMHFPSLMQMPFQTMEQQSFQPMGRKKLAHCQSTIFQVTRKISSRWKQKGRIQNTTFFCGKSRFLRNLITSPQLCVDCVKSFFLFLCQKQRGASAVKRVKSRLHSSMTNQMLESLLQRNLLKKLLSPGSKRRKEGNSRHLQIQVSPLLESCRVKFKPFL